MNNPPGRTRPVSAIGFALLLLAVLTTGDLEAVVGPSNSSEVTYPAAGAQAIAEFRATGTVTLQVPHDPQVAPTGEILVVANEEQIFADRDITGIGHEGLEVVGQIESIAITGTVAGHASTATLLLDPLGVYGIVTVTWNSHHAEFTFNPRQRDPGASDSAYDQHVRLELTGNDADPHPPSEEDIPHVHADGVAETACDAISQAQLGFGCAPSQASSSTRGGSTGGTGTGTGTSGGSSGGSGGGGGNPQPCATSYLWMIATAGSDGFSAQHADWSQRMSSGFQLYRQLFSDLCINLQAKISRTTDIASGGPAVLSTSNCDSNTITDQFSSWLWNNRNALWSYSNSHFVDSYQLWTARDLTSSGWGPDGSWCYGVGRSDSTKHHESNIQDRKNGAINAISIMEGVDVNCCSDGYDPDEVKHRAIVSGHETAHVYGEENHPGGHCGQPGGNYNMMKNGIHKDNANVCLWASSGNEIKQRYFYGAEY